MAEIDQKQKRKSSISSYKIKQFIESQIKNLESLPETGGH
jgi:hypothetical protein